MLQMYGTPRSSDGFKDDKTLIKREIVSCLTVLTKATVYSPQAYFTLLFKLPTGKLAERHSTHQPSFKATYTPPDCAPLSHKLLRYLFAWKSD